MKFLCASFLLIGAAKAAEMHSCTYGKLFVSDANSPKIYIFDTSTGNTENLAPETSITVPGNGGVYLQATASGKEVCAMYRGNEEVGYTDGAVSFIDTGVSTEDHGGHMHVEYGTPKAIENASFQCARAIHYVPHDNKIAIFCDGSYDAVPQVNSTVWVVDETKFGLTNGESAIVYTTTLQGSHHGVAVPVDDNHVLYSLASEDRIQRTAEGADYALPNTFQVTDYQGQILHSIDDESSPDKSCSGFHGSAAADNTISLACDADHGGILIVDYNDNISPSQGAYMSRALSYPTSYGGAHRIGSFAESPHHDLIVGSFADRAQDAYHLAAFTSSQETQLTESQVLTLEGGQQCGFMFEHSHGESLLVLMPNGILYVYKYTTENGWEELANVSVVPNMQVCTDVAFTAGVKQAYVLKEQTLYVVDIEGLVHEGETRDQVVKTSKLDFTPLSAVIGGVPLDVVCESKYHQDDYSSAPGFSMVGVVVSAILAMVMVSIFF